MRKLVLLLSVWFLCAGLAFAQETLVAPKGTVGFFVETSLVTVGDVGVKYFVNDNLAIGTGLFFSWDDEADPVKQTQIGVSPFLQYYLLERGPFGLYLGALAEYSLDHERDADADMTINDTTLGLGGMAGLDWFITDNVSLGARYRILYELDRTATKIGGTKVSSSDNSFTLAGYPQFILSFYLP